MKPLVTQRRDPPEQFLPLVVDGLVARGFVERPQTDLEHAHEVPYFVPRFVDGLEHPRRADPVIPDFEQALGELPRVVVVRALAKDVLDVRRRLAGLVQHLELDPPEPELHVEARLAQGRAESPIEQRREFLVSPLLLVEPVQRDERAVVVRVYLEDPFVGSSRLDGVFDDLLANERHLGEHFRLQDGVVGGRCCAIVERFELRPTLGAREDLFQSREGALIARITDEHSLQIRGRADGIAEPLFVKPCRLLAQLELDVGRKLRAERLPIRFSEIRRAIRGRRERLRAVPEVEVRRKFANRAQHDVECRVGRRQFPFLNVAQTRVEPEPILGLRRGREKLSERFGFLPRISGSGVFRRENLGGGFLGLRVRQESAQRGDGSWIVRRQLEHAAGGFECVLRSGEALDIELREFRLDVRALGAAHAVPMLLENLGRALRVAGRKQEARQSTERERVPRRVLEDPRVECPCAIGLGERFFFEGRPLTEHAHALVVRRRVLDAQTEQPAQIVPAPFAAEDRLERGSRLLVGRVGLEQVLVDRDRGVGARELARVDLREQELEGPSLLVLDLLRALLDRLDEDRPSAGGTRRRLERLERRRVVRGDRIRAARVPGRSIAIRQTLARDADQLLKVRELLGVVFGALDEQLVERGETCPLLVGFVERN